MYAELLARSCFSFLRGASRPAELVAEAERLGLRAIAVSDLNGLYGAVRSHEAARAVGLRFIVSAELILANQDNIPGGRAPLADEGESVSLNLLVQNARGYENLCRLLTLGHHDQDKGSFICEAEWLIEHHEGLTACLVAPRDPRRVRLPRYGDSLERLLAVLQGAFSERLVVLTYRHLDGLDKLRDRWAIRCASLLGGAPIVASARALYHAPPRKMLLDVLTCIRLGISLDDAGTRLSPNGEAYLRSEEQMLELFFDHRNWVEQAAKIAESCTFSLTELRYHFPCVLSDGQTADERLAELTWEGTGRRYPQGIDEALRSQIKKELGLIKKIGVAPYFLSTYDIVEIARRRKILCQGRGSAANSAVCFMLGITAVDPSRSKLLFERFLSEERAEPPDIDIDFEHERREEVIQEIYETYGRERAAMVSEIISYRSKSALREVSRVFGFSEEQAGRLSGTIVWKQDPETFEKRLVEAGFDLKDTRIRQVVSIAEQLRGFPRHLSIHVGGFVLSSRPLYEVAPVEPASMPGRTVVPWDKDDIDTLGFFKVDVLGLGMLTAIRKALDSIHRDGGLPAPRGPASTAHLARTETNESNPAHEDSSETLRPDFDPLEVITRIPAEDPCTYRMISRGDTVGVFQIESRAQMAMLPRLRPQEFYDLVIEVAIVRPGPIQGGMVHPFLRRRNGQEPISCPHPDLWPILERTLGVPLFQEQVMQIAIVGAGYTGGEADQLRRDMAAWKKHGRLSSHRQRLIDGFRKKGIAEEFAEALFEQIKGFGEYGFPESHASSFALLVYASSWQKRHFPAHFTCALLNSQPMGFYPPTSLVRDAQAHGVVVRDVCVLSSRWDCTLEGPLQARELRLGLRLVKDLGQETAERIISARRSDSPESLADLMRRARLKKNEVEALAESGALEALSPGRRDALWKARAPQTPGLFEQVDGDRVEVALPELREAEQLVLDYGRKGLSVADHPLRHHRKRLQKLGATRTGDLFFFPRGRKVALAGLVMARQRPATASGVVFMTLEDETGSANLIVYANVFEQYHHVARHSQMLWVVGEVERDETLPIAVPPQRARDTPHALVEHPALTMGEDDSPIPVIHVIVHHIERWGNTASPLMAPARNFH